MAKIQGEAKLTMTKKTLPECGWGRPPGSRKFHWFVDGTSICGRWGFFKDYHLPPEGGYGAKQLDQDCAACWKKIEALVGAKALGTGGQS